MCLSEVPFFYLSAPMIRKVGVRGVVAITEVAYLVRFIYYSVRFLLRLFSVFFFRFVAKFGYSDVRVVKLVFRFFLCSQVLCSSGLLHFKFHRATQAPMKVLPPPPFPPPHKEILHWGCTKRISVCACDAESMRRYLQRTCPRTAFREQNIACLVPGSDFSTIRREF